MTDILIGLILGVPVGMVLFGVILPYFLNKQTVSDTTEEAKMVHSYVDENGETVKLYEKPGTGTTKGSA